MRFVVFVTVVSTVLGGVHAYLRWRLVAATARTRHWRRAGTVALTVLAVSVVLAFMVARALPGPLATGVEWVGYLWLGVMFYLLVALLALEPVRLVAWLVGRARRTRGSRPEPAQVTPPREPVGAAVQRVPAEAAVRTDPTDAAVQPDPPPPAPPEDTTRPAPADPGRRLFLSRALALTAGVVAVGTVGYGVRQATGPVGVRRVTVTLDRLDPALDGFRIALLADVHLPQLHGPYLGDVVATVNRLDAGLVAVVGDLVDGDVDELGAEASALADLRSRHGTYFVTGNHEYYSGVDQWVEFLPTVGVRVLRNERLEVREAGGVLDLAGIDDVAAQQVGQRGHGPDLDAALDGRDRDRAVVLLAHQPVQWPGAVRRGVDLQLSGHTHGGQMWPFHQLVKLEQPVVGGLARRGDSQIYVTAGTGLWGPPVRVGAPSEITCVELRTPR